MQICTCRLDILLAVIFQIFSTPLKKRTRTSSHISLVHREWKHNPLILNERGRPGLFGYLQTARIVWPGWDAASRIEVVPWRCSTKTRNSTSRKTIHYSEILLLYKENTANLTMANLRGHQEWDIVPSKLRIAVITIGN